MTLIWTLVALIDVGLLAAVVAGRWPRPGDGRWVSMSPSVRAGLVAVAMAAACAGYAINAGWLGDAARDEREPNDRRVSADVAVAPLWDESQANAAPPVPAEAPALMPPPLLPRSARAPSSTDEPLPAAPLPAPEPATAEPVPSRPEPSAGGAGPRPGRDRSRATADGCPLSPPADVGPVTTVRIGDRLGPGQRRERLRITVEGCGTLRLELTRSRPRAELRVPVPQAGAYYRLDGDTDYDDGRRLTIAGEGWLDGAVTRYELRVLDEYSGIYQLEPQP